MTKIAPSILSADFTKLGQDIDSIKTADYLHFDVMDGIFVPNISIGIPVLESVRKYTDMVLDVHLMITEPVRYVERFADAGADIVVFHLEADTPENIALAVSFDYGSNHNKREIGFAAHHCNALGIEHLIVPLDFISKHFKSSLLEGADAIPEGGYADDNMKSTVVPFRNGIMLSIACGIAESRGLKSILIANHFGDHSIYPDCRADFIKPMCEAIKAGTYEGITIDAPYTSISKTDIAKIGKELGIDYSLTYSCYKGGEKHCGKCGTCIERKEALRDAGIQDPTNYEED